MHESEHIEALRALPGEFTPPSRIWAAIAEQIQPAPTNPRRWPLASAGLALAATLAALALIVPPLRNVDAPQARMLAREAAAIRAEYAAALAQLPPADAVSHVQPALDALAQRTAGLEAALRADPNNAELLYALQHAWAQRLRVARLAAEFQPHRGDS